MFEKIKGGFWQYVWMFIKLYTNILTWKENMWEIIFSLLAYFLSICSNPNKEEISQKYQNNNKFKNVRDKCKYWKCKRLLITFG